MRRNFQPAPGIAKIARKWHIFHVACAGTGAFFGRLGCVRNHVRGPKYRRDIDRPRTDRLVVSNSVEDKKTSEEQKWILVRKKGKVSNMKKVRFMEKDKTQDGDNND